MKFSDNLRNLRREKEYSQEYLAERLGVTRRTISKWENGHSYARPKKANGNSRTFWHYHGQTAGHGKGRNCV